VIANLGRLVEANLEPLATQITREVGKPIAESRGEVREVLDTCMRSVRCWNSGRSGWAASPN
jgi:acyl-CoA reductase-like NAD-dependent aldehyde dehydrogenase